jgi:tartrate-resistant acid phosphatase type 5
MCFKSKYRSRLFQLLLVGFLVFWSGPRGSGGWTRGSSEDLADKGPIKALLSSAPRANSPAYILNSGTNQPAHLRFAVIGDYGSGDQNEADVAALVDSWNPDFIITTGDNNYPEGGAETIDQNIGQFFHQYIYPYTGAYGVGAQVNRFFPSLGNHDWMTSDGQPYLDYFTLPGNERYYEFSAGPVDFYVLNSVYNADPDGFDADSAQAIWLMTQLAMSDADWQIVYMHHPPYSSGNHGSSDWMQWPYAFWGVDVVLSGHDHTYERIFRDGITYFVNGLSGSSKYEFGEVVEGSQFRYNQDFGAMLVETQKDILKFRFINRQGETIDDYEIARQVNRVYLPVIQQ